MRAVANLHILRPSSSLRALCALYQNPQTRYERVQASGRLADAEQRAVEAAAEHAGRNAAQQDALDALRAELTNARNALAEASSVHATERSRAEGEQRAVQEEMRVLQRQLDSRGRQVEALTDRVLLLKQVRAQSFCPFQCSPSAGCSQQPCGRHKRVARRAACFQMVDLSGDERARALQQALHAREGEVKRARSAADASARAASDAEAATKRAQGAFDSAEAAATEATARAERAERRCAHLSAAAAAAEAAAGALPELQEQVARAEEGFLEAKQAGPLGTGGTPSDRTGWQQHAIALGQRLVSLRREHAALLVRSLDALLPCALLMQRAFASTHAHVDRKQACASSAHCLRQRRQDFWYCLVFMGTLDAGAAWHLPRGSKWWLHWPAAHR